MHCLALVRDADHIAEHEFDARDDLKKISRRRSRKRDAVTIYVDDFDLRRLLAQSALPPAAFHQCKVGIGNEKLDRDEGDEDAREIIGHEHRCGFRRMPVEE